MDDAKYRELVEAKNALASAYNAEKRKLREQIAAAILRAPEFALTFARGALSNKAAPWQQWSRDAWHELLRTKEPTAIASLLVDPADGNEEALADSHPFAGLTAAVAG